VKLDTHRPRDWSDWYRFARDELGYAHDESAEYANLRFVEEQNRANRDGGRGEAPSRSRGAAPSSASSEA
jgi:hypothetical protein